MVRFRQKIKLKAVIAAGGVCQGCGLSEPVDALEFHHLDPHTKEFGISMDGLTRTWEHVEAELAKCVLACANCHREAHAGLRHFGPVLSEAAGPFRVRAA